MRILIVKLVDFNGNVPQVEDIDIVDGTPILDIKPYVPEFDIRAVKRTDWLEENVHKLPEVKDDCRFVKSS